MSNFTDRNIETISTWNKVAKLYEDKFMGLDLYNDTYDAVCDLVIDDNAQLLEIGCGPGNIIKYILSKRPDYKILGIDIAESMINLAKKNNPSASFKVMDGRDIKTLNDKFDGILCGFCLPYLSKEERGNLILDCSTLLSKEGILYISFIDGNYNDSLYIIGNTGDRMYFYYHELAELETELVQQNFDILNVTQKEYITSTKIETHTILIAQLIQ